jgi:hypothetical protein
MKDDIPLKIFSILADSDKPLARKDICSIGSIQPQLFDYWISSMIKSSIIIPTDRNRYTIQPIFKNKGLPELMIPLIKKIAIEIKNNNGYLIEDIVSSNLSLYLKYLAEDIL